MESKERLRNGYYNEIVAPDFLDNGQNIYDQEPFINAVGALVRNNGMTEDKAHYSMSRLVKDQEKLALPSTPTNGFYEMDIQEQEGLIEDYAKKLRNSAKKEEYELYKNKKVVKTIFRELIEYPHWGEYLGLYVQSNVFYHNGERNTVKGNEEVESYAKWINDKLKREKRITFEWEQDDIPREVPSYDTTPKKWQILRTSELMRRR